MTTSTIPHPPIISHGLWLAERKKLLAHEKELTKHLDRINAERRRLPMVKIEKNYVFEGSNGKQCSSKNSAYGSRQEARTLCVGYAKDGIGKGRAARGIAARPLSGVLGSRIGWLRRPLRVIVRRCP